MDKKYIIPRNIINYSDTFPFDFIAHIEISKRQIPYLLSGIAVTAVAVTVVKTFIPITLIIDGAVKIGSFVKDVETVNYIVKSLFTVGVVGLSYMMSIFKIDNQFLEQFLNNCIIYNIDKIKFKFNDRRHLNAKDFKGGVPEFRIQETRN